MMAGDEDGKFMTNVATAITDTWAERSQFPLAGVVICCTSITPEKRVCRLLFLQIRDL